MGLWCGGPVRAMIALGVYQLALGYYGAMKALVPIVLALAVAGGAAVWIGIGESEKVVVIIIGKRSRRTGLAHRDATRE